jgi:hypothetical protein
MINHTTIMFIACALFILGTLIYFAADSFKKAKKIEMLEARNESKNDYIARLYAELKKAKGIDKPFIVPLDPAPDFDIEAVFKAAEEEAKAEAAAEEAEEGGAA